MTKYLYKSKSLFAGVENGEYFGLSSSDYHSDLSDHSPRGRSLTRPDLAPVSRHDRLSVDRERRDTRHQDMTRHQSVDRLRHNTGARDRSRQAMVLCDYKRKHFTEVRDKEERVSLWVSQPFFVSDKFE